MTEYKALSGRTRASLQDLEHVIQRIEMLRGKAAKTGDDGYWDAVALNLHSFYVAVERMFEDIARSMDKSLPEGPDWHLELLIQMSAEIPETRPPVIRRETRSCLDEYRGFRHVVRNVYTFNLRPSRLAELVDDLAACLEAVRRDLSGFSAFLDTLA